MQINVTIMLGPGEYAGDLAGNAEELAAKILTDVGADLSKDTCSLVINDSGYAGTSMPLPPAP